MPTKTARFPGWRHMTAAQRRNARFDEIWAQYWRLNPVENHRENVETSQNLTPAVKS